MVGTSFAPISPGFFSVRRSAIINEIATTNRISRTFVRKNEVRCPSLGI